MQMTTPTVLEGGPNPRHPPTQQSNDDIKLETVSRLPRDPLDGEDERKPHLHGTTTVSTTLPTTRTKAQYQRSHVQFAALCWALFLAGWNDGAMGPMLPRIQKVYHVNFVVVSLLFVFTCIGFSMGAFSNVVLNHRYGFGKIIVFGSILQVIAYALVAAALPFPAIVLGCTINGIGVALQDAQANGFVASLKDNTEAKMGLLHAAYGAGALASPLVATQFAQLPRWSFHYLVSLGLALINTSLLLAVFRLKSQDECLAEIGQPTREQSENEKSHFKQILALKDVHLMALFILVYVGVEVTLGGWIVTYIIDVRGGGPSSGYISSGFFGGLMTGRVVLLWLNRKESPVGERRVLFIYALLAITLELVVWFVPSLIGNAVSISIIGLLLGPMYPITMNHAGRVLPAWLLTGAIGWIAGFGQAGSALLPFMTGAIASKAGIRALQPLLVSMMVFMMIIWALVPSKGSRRAD